jgi:hypothetical protein
MKKPERASELRFRASKDDVRRLERLMRLWELTASDVMRHLLAHGAECPGLAGLVVKGQIHGTS